MVISTPAYRGILLRKQYNSVMFLPTVQQLVGG